MDKNKVAQLAKAVIETETRAAEKLLERIDDTFTDAIDAMLHCKGRVVVLGMGKSGHIGNKIAATLASRYRMPNWLAMNSYRVSRAASDASG